MPDFGKLTGGARRAGKIRVTNTVTYTHAPSTDHDQNLPAHGTHPQNLPKPGIVFYGRFVGGWLDFFRVTFPQER